ncbi:hypothetical protein HDU96_005025 [Phlyctochytrium bullatum]|nr:hypothetical protein HDU96_005025 [Phlyctochytrium bullatum]
MQKVIEEAWKEGIDREGAKQLKQKLVKTRKWIGATEAVVFFSIMGVRVNLIDFPHPTGGERGHPALLDFVEAYFDGSLPSFREGIKRRKHHFPVSFNRNTTENGVYITDHPPLYFQHRFLLLNIKAKH